MEELSNLFKHLNQLTTQEYLAVQTERNPLVQILPSANHQQLVCIMQQYCILTKEYLVSITYTALEKVLEAGRVEVAQEIQKNIAEELGDDTTEGVAHYQLLAEGLEEGLSGFFLDPEPLPATSKLLEKLISLFSQKVPYILGIIYAIEMTSMPDIRIGCLVIESLFKNGVQKKLKHFFDNHLNEWEPEHEADLRAILTKNLDVNELGDFEAGFRAYLAAMNKWWEEITFELISCKAA